MTFLDTTSAVWVLIMVLPAIDLAKKEAALFAALHGGMSQLDAYLGGTMGGNFLARWRGEPVPSVRTPRRAWGIGFLVLPQATPEVRRARSQVWASIARTLGAAIVAWVVAITVESQTTFSLDLLRAIQFILAAGIGVWLVRTARLPADRRAIPAILALGGALGATFVVALTLLPIR